MKKSSKTTKPKEVVDFDLKSRPIVQSRSDPSIVRPSLHPWYYVKGRKDLTEKNISSRRERDEQRHRQCVSDSQFFSKRLAETQLLDNWKDNKTLVKHQKHSSSSLKPPYDVSVEPKPKPGLDIRLNKELGKKYSKAKQKLTDFMEQFKHLDQNYNKLEKRQKVLVFQLKEVRKINDSVEEKSKFYELLEIRLSNNRFNRDKLRKKVFQIIENLISFKMSVKKVEVLKNIDGVLTEEEMIQLSEVIERAIKILDMYIDLNQSRNNEFQIMFDEEADNRWETQDIEWQTEYDVWNVMTQKLIQSFVNVIKEKLRQLLTEQTNALEERQQLVKELTEFSAKIKTDSQLSLLLTENVEEFLTKVETNVT